jgi:hypothetical protein
MRAVPVRFSAGTSFLAVGRPICPNIAEGVRRRCLRATALSAGAAWSSVFALPSSGAGFVGDAAPASVGSPLSRLELTDRTECGNRHREMVQRLQGFRIHHAG